LTVLIAAKNRGYALTGMRDGVEDWRELSLDSHDEGTRLVIRLPLSALKGNIKKI